jgi:choline kinase
VSGCLSEIDVAILCGGRGTRLAPVIGDLPKVLAPIKGRPFIEHLLDYLREFGAKRVWLIAGHRYEQVEKWWWERGPKELALKIIRDHNLVGGWSALRDVTERFSYGVLALNGDTLLSGDFGRLAGYYSGNAISYNVRGVPSGIVRLNKFQLQDNPLVAISVEVLSGLEFLDIGTPEGYAKAEAFLDNQ